LDIRLCWLGDGTTARSPCGKPSGWDPNNTQAGDYLAVLLVQKGRPEESVALMREIAMPILLQLICNVIRPQYSFVLEDTTTQSHNANALFT